MAVRSISESIISRCSVIIGILFVLFLSPASDAAQFKVAPSGAPYTSIQAAIDAASENDTILIASGTYSDHHAKLAPDGYPGPAAVNQIIFIDKKLSIIGGYDLSFTVSDPVANPTVIDALNQSRCVFAAPSTDPLIDGLILRNGNAISQGGAIWGDVGGGLYAGECFPVLLDCTIDSCYADGGGGLFLAFCDYFNLLHCSIENNSSNDFGGGLYTLSSDGYMEDCDVISNFCDGIGGGAYISYMGPTVTDCRFSDNIATQTGGGLALFDTSTEFTENAVMNNNARDGAGLRCYNCTGTIGRNNIQRNISEYKGGGVYLENCNQILVNNFICRNGLTDPSGIAAGIMIDGGMITMVHNTVSRNTGGDRSGIYITDITAAPGVVSIINQITSSHAIGLYVNSGSSVFMDTTHWHDNTTNWTGPGSVNPGSTAYFGDPLFVDAAAGDFHVQFLSPVKEKASTTWVTEDIDGHVRPWDGDSDIGADEQRFTPDLGVWINMPQFVSPDDSFFIHGYLENSGSPLNDIQVFFLLEIYGEYWFWPGWTHYDLQTGSGLDYETRNVASGQTRIYVMNTFTWPDTGTAAINYMAIWGGMLDPFTSALIGDYGYAPWGFGP
ncbi:hypothetical protein JW823_09135 [bacterium]|nr:hypothetical protein [candidate division CSSED10-310 bacterium]